jgi:hypothetical protein
VEELFGQLWNVPNPRPRVREAESNGGCLVWVRRDLLREKRVTPQDCFLTNREVRMYRAPTKLRFARDIWGGGEKGHLRRHSQEKSHGGWRKVGLATR